MQAQPGRLKMHRMLPILSCKAALRREVVRLMSDLTRRPRYAGWADSSRAISIDDEMMCRFSHQLRSLLTSVGAAAEFLLHNDTDRSVHDEMLGIISEQATRIDGLLEDFLVIARDTPRRQASVSEVNLYHVTREAVRELAAEAQSIGAWLVLDAAGVVPPVIGHHQPLRQAVTGALRTLIHLTKTGERLTVRLEAGRDEAGEAVVELWVAIQSDDPLLPDRARCLPPGDLALEAARRICESHGGAFDLMDDAPGIVCRLPAATLRLAPAIAAPAGTRGTVANQESR